MNKFLATLAIISAALFTTSAYAQEEPTCFADLSGGDVTFEMSFYNYGEDHPSGYMHDLALLVENLDMGTGLRFVVHNGQFGDFPGITQSGSQDMLHLALSGVVLPFMEGLPHWGDEQDEALAEFSACVWVQTNGFL